MKFHHLIPVVALTMLVALQGCLYQNEQDLYPQPPQEEEEVQEPVDTCGIPDVISYKNDVLPLLEKHYCVACHETASPAGGITLEGYGRVVPYVEDGSLLGSIRYEPGYDPMPKEYDRMPDCEVEVIAKWIDQGYANN